MLTEALAEAKRRTVQQAAIERLQLHPGQALVIEQAKRFNVLACGRRWGKTELGIDLGLETLSDGYPVGWFAPTYKILIEAWDRTTRFLKPITVRSNRTERRIELTTGGVLEGWTLEDPDAGRSRKYKRVIVDEAAQAPYLQEAWQKAIRPTLGDYEGDAWFLSSTRGRNYFWQLFQLGQDPLEPEYMSWQMPTVSNPFFPQDEFAAAREELPEAVFRQEWLAEFLENEGAVFRNLAECLTAPATNPIEHRGHNIVFGVDWGKHSDYTAICAGCATCRVEVALDRFNQIDYVFQRGRLAVLADGWKPNLILAESNAMGEPVIEQLQRDGLPVRGFVTTAMSKPPLIENLALTFERAEWRFLPDAVARGEAEAYERKVSTTTGRSTYSAPPGMHDDTVMARALMREAAGFATNLPDKQHTKRSTFASMGTSHGDEGGSKWKKF